MVTSREPSADHRIDHAILRSFHHAFPVDDLDAARRFYGEVLGCPPARRQADRASDFQFFGHHVIAHLVAGEDAATHRAATGVANVAVRHIGAVLPRVVWHRLWERLQAADVAIVFGPELRRPGEPSEEALVLAADPFGNIVEFKSFTDDRFLFSVD